MKKILDGVHYDSRTAIEIGTASSGGHTIDLSYWQATLYRTMRSGRYFLVGEGGPQTRWGTPRGQNSWGYGKALTPLAEGEAYEWAIANLPTAIVMRWFPAMFERYGGA